MQMPMFSSVSQQQNNGSGGDDIDLNEIFADYLNEDDETAQYSALAKAQAAANFGLPTGQGIKTAWHSGSLPIMQGANLGSNLTQQPAAKRSRAEENLYLPTGMSMGMQGTAETPGGLGGISSQQLSMTTGGIGSLSGRLGFNVTSAVGGVGGIQQQSQMQQQGFLTGSNNVNLPVGMGVKVGSAAGNMVTQGQGTGIGALNGNGSIHITSLQWGQGLGGVSHMQYGVPFQVDKASIEDQMTAERRLRNREHAKRSRVRKKFMLESLQQQVRGLQEENSALRMLVQKHIPQHALKIIDECCSKSPLFDVADLEGDDSGSTEKKEQVQLLKSDFSLIESLTSGQQNFVLSDPRLPDNPIVFASPGFYELTGYTREQVLGRNCRFLQGTGTDPKSVDIIRTAIANGTDATACFLNYKADGTPFWNQLFVAALRDADNCIVNYVGVQTMVEPNAGASALEDKVNAAHPLQLGIDEGDNDDKDGDD
ncbi:hypothetical protein ACHAXS_007917 [Conticribra weissflogii]